MKANRKYTKLPYSFWANIKSISQQTGYTVKGKGIIKVPTIEEIISSLVKLGLTSYHLIKNDSITPLGQLILGYYDYRAKVLNTVVEPLLMDVKEAEKEYLRLSKILKPTCPQPMNKQKGKKRTNAFLTCIVNMLIEANIKPLECDYDPRVLTTITKDDQPLRTLSRRVDGAFPNTINPIAIWEIKEYYYTTTFGSRVADGVYETLLDGMELEELLEHEKCHVLHYLMIDAHYTWWDCGKAYLCRIIDMLHMGYVDEVLFGKEIITELPKISNSWVAQYTGKA